MKKALLALLAFTLFFTSCDKDDNPTPAPEPTVELNDKNNDFVWKAMNHWYFWQANVDNLSDTKDDNIDEYHKYLNGFSKTKDLFSSLKYNADDFSWFIPDVDKQLSQFRGVSVSYGIRMPRKVFRVNPDDENNKDYYIYINYVVPNSPADIAGFKRGDLIYKVKNQVLNASNYTLLNDVIFPEEGSSMAIAVGTLENDKIKPRLEKTLSATKVSENPLHHTSVINEGGKKIGYLVYNSFKRTYNGELNEAFEKLKQENINELILDLRYNRGGSVLTSAYLASMIEGNKPRGNTFAKLTYNSKRNATNGRNYPFFNNAALFDKETGKYTETQVPINRLTNLNTLYVITSKNTASASEMIINGLRPSMKVVLVGLTTTGKNEGSNTIVDAPATKDREIYTNIDGRKSNIGMQPITFQIFNSLDQNDYGDGFTPDIQIDELEFSKNILPFGDTNEALLRKTLDQVVGVVTKSKLQKSSKSKVKFSKLKTEKFADEMYTFPDEEELIKNK